MRKRFMIGLMLLGVGCDPAVTIGNTDAGAECQSDGRTCDSIFGSFELKWVPAPECAPSWSGGDSTRVIFGSFDGGMGPVTVGWMESQSTRQGCATLLPSGYIGSAGPVELAYEPTCQTLRGTLLSCCTYADGGRGNCALMGSKL